MWWDQSLHLRVGSFSFPDAKILIFFHPSKGVERYAKEGTDIERYETEKQAARDMEKALSRGRKTENRPVERRGRVALATHQRPCSAWNCRRYTM